MGFAVYRKLPSSAAVRGFLERAFRLAGARPAYFITEQGTPFTEMGFRRWCRHWGIQHRLGALGKYGSLAVIERGIRTIKSECTRQLCIVPYRLAVFEQGLTLYSSWYSAAQPPTRSTTVADQPAAHRASSPACDGLGDPLAPPRGPSSEANPRSGSICRVNSSLSGDIYRSSRSSAPPRGSRPE
jgi:hypothetical protein